MTYNIRKATALVTAGWVACAAMMMIGGVASAQSILVRLFGHQAIRPRPDKGN